jgi:hypothetical protein
MYTMIKAEEEGDDTLALREKLEQLRHRRRRLKEVTAQVSELQNQTLDHLDTLHREQQQSLEELGSLLQHRYSLKKFLEVSERWNVINDCFHIWHQGPFASINNCRLGAEAPSIPAVWSDDTETHRQNVYTGKHAKAAPSNAPQPQRGWGLFSSSSQVANDTTTTTTSSQPAPVEAPKVPWAEVNAALGHMVLLVQILARLSKVNLPHTLHPMGASTRITIKGSLYNVYFEESSLWGRHNLRNFHAALNGLCECILSLSKTQTDKTIAVPHAMIYDNASLSWKIGGIPLVYGYGSSGVDFTRACKYLLTDLKWLVAYSVKHHAER